MDSCLFFLILPSAINFCLSARIRSRRTAAGSSDEIGLQLDDNKAVEKIAATEPEKQPSSGCKIGCAGVGNVASSKVTEKYKRNKCHEVNYCYGEGESL